MTRLNGLHMSTTRKLTITCTDGFALGATLYEPTKIKAAVLIGPATGIKRTFYHSFAAFLAAKGYAVLTFDNRGIGDSKGASLNSGNPSIANWGRLDMTAALELLKQQFPDTQYHLIGHSAGGQLVGLMENAKELTSLFNFACSSGSIQNARYPFKFLSFFWLNLVIPTSNFLFGYTKSQWFGMGEPLPKKVATDWRRYCNGLGYIKVDLDKTIHDHLYNELDLPSQWLHATDDEIANLANVKDMIRVHPKLTPEIITLQPSDYGYKGIGHMSFFSSKKKELWNYATDWLERF